MLKVVITNELIKFIVARDNPRILKLTFLHPVFGCCSVFKILSLYKLLISSLIHPENSAKISFSIPK